MCKWAAPIGLKLEAFNGMDTPIDFVKKSGTGNEQSEAKRAPLKSKDSLLFGSERTSDAQQTAATGKRPHHAQAQASGGEQKRK